MRSFLRNLWRTSIIGNLVTGSLVVLPFVLTVLIIGWGLNWIVAAFGPAPGLAIFCPSAAPPSSAQNAKRWPM